MAWGKVGSTTLSSAGDLITVDSLSNNKCITILNHVFSSGQGKLEPKLNNDGTVNYTVRYELDGAAEVTLNTSTDFENTTGGFTNGSTFHVQYLVNIATEEKLLISHSCEVETTGTSGVPRLREYVGKWRNTSDAVSRYDVPNVGTGDFASGSNSTLIGSDLTPAAAITFPTNVQVGSRAEITDTRKIYYRIDSDYVTDKWYELGTVPYAGGRAVFGGGYNTSSSAEATIDYVTIATLGNASDFGDLTQARYGLGAMANKTRALFAGGTTGGGNQTTIDFITPATLGDATTFGSISNDTAKTYGVMCLSSETRGIIAGGESGYSNRIDYVTIATTGNSTSFGATLTVAGKQGATTSDGTRGVFIGGEGRTPTMDFITIGTTGTCTDFADLRTTLNGGSHGLATDGTIGVFTTGQSFEANIEKITIAGLPANSTTFGDMTTGRSNLALASDKTRAIFAGGKTASGTNYTNTIEYSAIPTPSGNAADFGDLTVARQVLAGASDTGADRS